MRFVAISDTHLARPELPEGDVLLHAGDLTYSGNLPETSEAACWLEDQKRKKNYKHVIVIAGNHDWLFQREPSLARQLMKERGLTYLEDSGVTLAGAEVLEGIAPGAGRITIYGSPWQPEFMHWAFNLKRGQSLKEKWAAVPAGIDILLTHGPPHGILDEVGRFNEDAYPDDSSIETRHVGCEELLVAVARVKPRAHVFGHVHGSRGRLERDRAIFINASIMNEVYDPQWKPIAFDLPEEGPDA